MAQVGQVVRIPGAVRQARSRLRGRRPRPRQGDPGQGIPHASSRAWPSTWSCSKCCARRRRTTASPSPTEDVKAQVVDIKEMFQGDQERFDAALKTENLTLEQFKESLRQRLLIDAMKAAVTKDVTVTEEEVQAYYDSHKARLHQAGDPRSPAHPHLPVRHGRRRRRAPSSPPRATGSRPRAEAEKVRSEIQNGADFGTEAAQVLRRRGHQGRRGRAGHHHPRPDGAGVRGGRVRSQEGRALPAGAGREYGYHLIQVTDITPEKQMPYDQVKEKIRSALLASRSRRPPGTPGSTTQRGRAGRDLPLGVRSAGQATTTSTMIPLTPRPPPRRPRPRRHRRPEHHRDERTMSREDMRRRTGRPLRPHHEAAGGVPLGPQADPGEHHRLHAGGDPRAGRRHPRARPARGDDAVRGELGDLLFQVYFMAAWPRSRGSTTWATWRRASTRSWCGGIRTSSARAWPRRLRTCKKTWDVIKKESEGREGIFHDVPRAFPATLLAQKLQQRAAAVGFDWEQAVDVMAKVEEETGRGAGGGAWPAGRIRSGWPTRWAICCSRWSTWRGS